MAFIVLVVFVLVGCFGSPELLPYSGYANDQAMVVVGGLFRFTVLTERVIRIEQRSSQNVPFESRPSLAFINRAFATVPPFNVSQSPAAGFSLSTSQLRLTFNGTSLSSLSIAVANAPRLFRWGDVDDGNLFGTIRSLDNIGPISLNCSLIHDKRVHDESLHCRQGFCSRNGWTIVDDHTNFMLDSDLVWWQSRNADLVDSYFFGHGNDYVGAIYDYSLLGGKVPMTPRAAVGILWSRWYDYAGPDVSRIVDDYETRGLPLDAVILDMDWHRKPYWGGYSFDENLFPQPHISFQRIKARGLLTSGNLHDHDGVRPSEDSYNAFCKAVGANPSSGTTFAFDIVNRTYAWAVEDTILQPLEQLGFGDFWWIDWQQGGQKGGCAGDSQNPTIWLNRLRGTNHLRRNQTTRNMILSRWGGLGSHRYPIGFSGDVLIPPFSWKALQFQPYFTFSAANVLFTWSHDLVGPWKNQELFTRWLQWGAFSPAFRTHDRGMAEGEICTDLDVCWIIKVWDSPYFQFNRDAMLERHALMPYLYNAMRQAFDTGLVLVRPMYYYYPLLEQAYAGTPEGAFPQYFFGPDMMVSPVVQPLDSTTSMASQSIWIPPNSCWIDVLNGSLLANETILNATYDLSEVPRFVRCGVILPKLPVRMGHTIGQSVRQYSELEFQLFIDGSTSGSVLLYEDDAATTAYLHGAFAQSNISFIQHDTLLVINVAPPPTTYPEFPTSRSRLLFRWLGLPPVSISNFSYSLSGGPWTWRYDGLTLEVVVETGPVSTQVPLQILVKLSEPSDALYGARGIIRRATLAKSVLDTVNRAPGTRFNVASSLSKIASISDAICAAANNNSTQVVALLQSLPTTLQTAIQEVKGLVKIGAEKQIAHALALLQL